MHDQNQSNIVHNFKNIKYYFINWFSWTLWVVGLPEFHEGRLASGIAVLANAFRKRVHPRLLR